MQLTSRDREILCALAWKVRLFSLGQIAAHWWPDSPARASLARARLGILEAAGLVRRRRLLARPLPTIEHPCVCWTPPATPPLFGHVAFLLQRRWVGGVTATTVYVLGKQAQRLVGGPARRRLAYPLQATHDLGVAAMYLAVASQSPRLAERWVGEDAYAANHRGKIPDAVLMEPDGTTVERLLEFGGDYDKRRVEAFHRYAASFPWPYEIW